MWSACTLPPPSVVIMPRWSRPASQSLRRGEPFHPSLQAARSAAVLAPAPVGAAPGPALARPAVLVGVSTAFCREKLGVSCCAAAGSPPAGTSLSAVDAGRGEERPPAGKAGPAAGLTSSLTRPTPLSSAPGGEEGALPGPSPLAAPVAFGWGESGGRTSSADSVGAAAVSPDAAVENAGAGADGVSLPRVSAVGLLLPRVLRGDGGGCGCRLQPQRCRRPVTLLWQLAMAAAGAPRLCCVLCALRLCCACACAQKARQS